MFADQTCQAYSTTLLKLKQSSAEIKVAWASYLSSTPNLHGFRNRKGLPSTNKSVTPDLCRSGRIGILPGLPGPSKADLAPDLPGLEDLGGLSL